MESWEQGDETMLGSTPHAPSAESTTAKTLRSDRGNPFAIQSSLCPRRNLAADAAPYFDWIEVCQYHFSHFVDCWPGQGIVERAGYLHRRVRHRWYGNK
jgi:hypothetical protein